MDNNGGESKWATLRVSKEFLAKLKAHCDEIGQKMTTFVTRAAEKEMAKKSE